MDKLRQMEIFVSVAEEGSFSGAARRLHMSPPAVTRAISSLEAGLSIKLFQRTTRFVRLTEAGSGYLLDVKKILNDIHIANNAAAGINENPVGHLSITAPVMFGRLFVLPVITEYLEKYPDTKVDAIFLDRFINMLEEGVDIGIRIGHLENSSMQAIKIGSVRLILCASPQYIKKYGEPKTPKDLDGHMIVNSESISPGAEWRFYHGGKEIIYKAKPKLNVTSNSSAIDVVLGGYGITRLLSYHAMPHLASGALKVFMKDYEPMVRPIHIIHREGRLATAKVRAFIDLIASRLRNDERLN